MDCRIAWTLAILAVACTESPGNDTATTFGMEDSTSAGTTAGPTTNDDDGSSTTTTGVTTVDETNTDTTGGPPMCAPSLLGTVETENPTLGVAVFGPRGYATHAMHGLIVLDVTNPMAPTQIGELALSNPTSLLVQGTTVYVGDPTGLYVVNAANGASPMQTGAVMDPDIKSITSIFVDGTDAYVTDVLPGESCSTCGLHLISLESMTVRESLPLADEAWDAVIAGNYAFVALGTEGLAIVDISTPTAMSLLDTKMLNGTTLDLVRASGRIYTAQGPGGFGILDVSNPMSIVQLGALVGDYVGSVAVALDGTTVWLGGMLPGIHVVDATDPLNIVDEGTLEGFDHAAGIAIGDGFALVGSLYGGVRTVAPPVCD